MPSPATRRRTARAHSDTVQKSGWAGLKNGKLLEKVSGKYEILLTIDKRIGHQQKIPGDVAVVTVRARSNRIQDLKPLVPEIKQALAQAQGNRHGPPSRRLDWSSGATLVRSAWRRSSQAQDQAFSGMSDERNEEKLRHLYSR